MEETKIPFFEVYTEDDLKTLPSFVRNQISDVLVSGKTKKTLVLPNGERYFMGNKLNDLTGSQWTFFTNSLLRTRYSTKGNENCGYKYRKIHPSPKPPLLLKGIIEFFTKENQLVLDFFGGVGGTLLASSLLNRKAIGIELEQRYIEAYQHASEEMNLAEQTFICGDSKKVLGSNFFSSVCHKDTVSLILIDPPYGNMMARPKTADDIEKYGNQGTPFSQSKDDLGNMDSSSFWDSYKLCVEKSLPYLKKGGHFVVFIKDLQPKGKETNLLHSKMVDVMNSFDSIQYLGLKIWADENIALFPYGYPFEFVANQIHQFILIFKKRA